MADYRKTLFISDLHLEDEAREITQAFLQLLNTCDPVSVDALYILGDLFEAWIGDDDNTPPNQDVIQALKALTQQGLPIYFIYGNRDFLISKKFLADTGCRLLPDETKINVYGTEILIMHGDSLCTHDKAYQTLRKMMRNMFLQTLFLWLPLKLRKYLAKQIRRTSRNHTQSKPLYIMDVAEETVRHIMQKHNVQCLIHGHTHRPAIHQFFLNQLSATRIVLGAWHDRANMLVWHETGEKNLMNLTNGV